MKIRKTKKGFTIVELVIVVAVIGILAAVLIPTFVNLTNKANETSDDALVKNLNTSLQMAEEEQGKKNDTFQEAIDDLKDFGYLLPNLVTRSDKKLLYRIETNRFVLDSKKEAGVSDVEYWEIVNEIPVPSEQKYSMYPGIKFSTAITSVDLTVGFDVGERDQFTSITYDPHELSEVQEVVIRTNGGQLNIGTSEADAAGKILHYGTLDEAIVYTTNNSFHTHGKIACMDLKAGKAVAEDKGYVALVKASEGTVVEEKDTGVFYIPTNAVVDDIDTTVAASIGYVSNEETTPSYVVDTTTAKGQERAQTLASTAYEIGSKFDLIAFRDAVNAGNDFAGITVKLTSDVDMAGYEWLTPIGINGHEFAGTFDGNSKKILNLSNGGKKTTEELYLSSTKTTGGRFGLFGELAGNVTIKDFTISVNAVSTDGQGWAAVVAQACGSTSKVNSLTIEDITVEGVLYASDKVAGIIAVLPNYRSNLSCQTIIRNCTNKATITGTRVGGIACSTNNYGTTQFINCKNEGTLNATTGTYQTAAGILTTNAGSTISFDSDCENTGEINASIAYDLATFVFTKFNSDGTYKEVTDTYSINSILEFYNNRFVGNPVTEYDWQWLETHSSKGDFRDYTGLFAGVTYGLDETYEIIVNERTDGENPFEYSRKFKTLDEALSHGLQNPTITMSSNQTLSYTFESGWTKGDGEVALLPTLNLSGNTLSVSKRLAKVQGIVTFKNGTINYTGTDELAHFANHGGLAFEDVTLNGGTISVEHAAANNCSITFDENSHITCTVRLSGSEASIIINGTTYTRSNGQYIVINDNVISQIDSLG